MPLGESETGVLLSLGVAVLWALGSIVHAAAGRRIGAFPTLLWRSAFATAALLLTTWLLGSRWPTGLQAAWLAASGVAGVAIGDACYYHALVRLGPRHTVQFTPFSPVFGAVIGWVFLGETLGAQAIAGAMLVLAASATAVWIAGRAAPDGREPGRLSAVGVALALAAALMMAVAAVMVRQGYRCGPPVDAVAVAALRVLSATVAIWGFRLVRGGGPRLLPMLRDRHAMVRVGLGTLVGPYLGMLGFVAALQHLEAGLVTTVVGLSPLIVLPIAAFRYRVRVGWPAVGAAAAAAAGVALIALRHRP